MAGRVYLEFEKHVRELDGSMTKTLLDPDSISTLTVHLASDDSLVETLTPVHDATGRYYGEIDETLYSETEVYYHKWTFDMGGGTQTTMHFFMLPSIGGGGTGVLGVAVVSRHVSVNTEVGESREVSVSKSPKLVQTERASRSVSVGAQGRTVYVNVE